MNQNSLNHKTTKVRVLGYCEYSEEELSGLIENGKHNIVQEAKGEFTIIYDMPWSVQIITSSIGAIHYFYYFDGHRFFHGQHVLDIVHELGLKWEWDWTSVGDLCEQENLTENRTMHKDIKRVPPCGILTYDGRLTLRSTRFLDTIKQWDADAVKAVDIFNDETSRIASAKPFLSLSGGFDSRVILSSMLKQKVYPTLVTLGNNQSTDLRVAGMIANRFGLEHRTVQLTLDDFFMNAENISYITNGAKPACHWHTFLYPKKVGIGKNETFFVGTLGEFARCYYFDKGLLAILLDGFSGNIQERFWRLKFMRHQTFKKGEQHLLSDNLRLQVSDDMISERALRNAKLSAGSLLAGGCRYYLEQRVPNFYANGIRMYNENSLWRSPFHNLEWLRTIWSLNENWKLGSNWHRLAINRNFPELLKFPEEKGFDKKNMLKKAPPLYWLPEMQRMKYQTYDLSEEWYKSDRIRDYILDQVGLLDEIAHQKLCEDVISEHKQFGTRTRTISFLLTLLYFKLSISSRT